MQPNLQNQIKQEIERAWQDAAPRIYLAILKSVEQSIRHNPEFAMRRDLAPHNDRPVSQPPP